MLHMLQDERSRGLIASELTQDRDDQGGLGDLVNFALGLLRRQYLLILFVTIARPGREPDLPAGHSADLHRPGKGPFRKFKPQLGQQQVHFSDSLLDRTGWKASWRS